MGQSKTSCRWCVPGAGMAAIATTAYVQIRAIYTRKIRRGLHKTQTDRINDTSNTSCVQHRTAYSRLGF